MSDEPIYITEETTTVTIDDEITTVTIEEPVTIIETDAPAGPPGPPGGNYFHQQMISSNTWVIDHNLGYRPIIQIQDSSGDLVTPQTITHNGLNQSIVYFLGAMGGEAYCS